MTDATKPRVALGTMPAAGAAGFLAAALCALALAPFASAADPVASGSTILTINSGLFNKLRKSGVKTSQVSPAKLSGRKATFTLTGGAIEPTTGLGAAILGGGLKFKAGKKTAAINGLSLDTTEKALNANVAGRKMKLASVQSFTASRDGFGVNLTLKTLKLTGSAASQLNKKLGFGGKSGGKGKGRGRAGASKAVQSPFKGNQVLGAGTTEAQPSTVAVRATGDATLALGQEALEKLAKVGLEFPPASGKHPFEVELSTVAPTSIVAPGPPPTVAFPISGGTMGPTATAGVLQTAGGLRLVQNLEALGANGNGKTTLTMGNVWVDLGAKTASVEVTIENNASNEETKKKLNLGNLGRASIADISLTGATISADPTNRTVTVHNATAALQGLTASTLNQVFIEPIEAATKEPQAKFAAGDPLGTFSFTAQTE